MNDETTGGSQTIFNTLLGVKELIDQTNLSLFHMEMKIDTIIDKVNRVLEK